MARCITERVLVRDDVAGLQGFTRTQYAPVGDLPFPVGQLAGRGTIPSPLANPSRCPCLSNHVAHKLVALVGARAERPLPGITPPQVRSNVAVGDSRNPPAPRKVCWVPFPEPERVD